MKIDGTGSTPSVIIENGIFEIKGRSIPENPFDFYSPILRIIEDYLKNPSQSTVLKFNLEYINSGSKKYVTKILSFFNQLYLQGKDVKVFWYCEYDDESMLELGTDLQYMVKVPIEIIEE